MAQLARILLIRPSALGDVCRTVPVLASLRAAFPEARIDWVVNEGYVPVIASHPALSAAVGFPRSRFSRLWRSPQVLRDLWKWAAELRRARYDLVLDCQGLGRSGLIAWSTGAPRRVGFSDAREAGWLGYNVRHEVPPRLHTVDRMLALAAAEGVRPVADLRLYAPPEALSWQARLRRQLRIGDRPYAVMAPTSRWLGKRWPAERWGALVQPLLDRGFDRVFLIGSPNERDQVGAAAPSGAAGERVVNLVGRTSVTHTLGLIAGADLVVANDSAPLHMAVGFDRRLVALFGPTDPARVGPYGRQAWVIRPELAPEERRVSFKDDRAAGAIMARISVPEVIERIDSALADRPLSTPGPRREPRRHERHSAAHEAWREPA